jgi:hypothetical protein
MKVSNKLPQSSERKSFKLKGEKKMELSTKKIKFTSLKADVKKYQRLITSLDPPIRNTFKEKERVVEIVEKVKISNKTIEQEYD